MRRLALAPRRALVSPATAARALHLGRATGAGTARATAGRAARELRRTPLRVTRVAFGLDDAGCAPPAERLDRLLALASPPPPPQQQQQQPPPRGYGSGDNGRGGGIGGGGGVRRDRGAALTNFVVVDGDAIARARAAGVPVWERAALDALLGGGGGGNAGAGEGAAAPPLVAREGLVIALHLTAQAGVGGGVVGTDVQVRQEPDAGVLRARGENWAMRALYALQRMRRRVRVE